MVAIFTAQGYAAVYAAQHRIKKERGKNMQEIQLQTAGINDNFSACCHGRQRRSGGRSHGRLATLTALLASLLLGVVACDTRERPIEPATSSTKTAVNVNTTPAPADEPRAAKVDKIAPAPNPGVASEQPLDLSLKPSLEDRQEGNDNSESVVSQETLLPDMFEQKDKSGKVSVSGGLLKQSYEEGLENDTVNGGEVSLQVKTR